MVQCHILLLHLCTGGRGLLDVRSRLQHNSENQRLVAREADHLQLEMMAQHTQTKMKVAIAVVDSVVKLIISGNRGVGINLCTFATTEKV